MAEPYLTGVLFVCTGNTCRSPMTQAIAINLAQGKELSDQYVFESAGTAPEDRVECKALWAVEKLGMNPFVIEEERTCVSLNQALGRDWNLVIAMTDGTKSKVRTQVGGKARVLTLRELAGESGDVPDPKGEPLAVYVTTAMEIRRCLEKGWPRLADSHAG